MGMGFENYEVELGKKMNWVMGLVHLIPIPLSGLSIQDLPYYQFQRILLDKMEAKAIDEVAMISSSFVEFSTNQLQIFYKKYQ